MDDELPRRKQGRPRLGTIKEAAPPSKATAVDSAVRALDRRVDLAKSAGQEPPALPDIDDLFGVVTYINRYRQGVPPSVLRQDVVDQFVIIRYLRHELDRRLYYGLDLALGQLGMHPLEVAAAVGVTTRQAVTSLRLRLRHGLRAGAPGHRSEVQARRETTTVEPRVEPSALKLAKLLVTTASDLVALAAVMPADLADEVQHLREATDPAVTRAVTLLLLRELLERADLPAEVATAATAGRPLLAAG